MLTEPEGKIYSTWATKIQTGKGKFPCKIEKADFSTYSCTFGNVIKQRLGLEMCTHSNEFFLHWKPLGWPSTPPLRAHYSIFFWPLLGKVQVAIHRMQIWRTTRSASRTSCTKSRLVRPRCFVVTMLPQRSLASRSIWPALPVPPFTSARKSDEGKEFTIA